MLLWNLLVLNALNWGIHGSQQGRNIFRHLFGDCHGFWLRNRAARTHKLVFVSWYAINLGEYLVILRNELTTMIFLLQF